MQTSFTIEEPAVSLSFRLPFLVAGLAGLALGLKGLVQAVSILSGHTPWPEYFAMGTLITIVALGLGSLCAWVFFVPSKTVVLDAAARVVRVDFRYPFGFRRQDDFPLGDLPDPEVLWHKDADQSEGGFWELKLTLPDGRKLVKSARTPNLDHQKQEAEAWKAQILAMRP